MESVIRIDCGGVSITFKGSEEFIRQSLPEVISEIGTIIADWPLAQISVEQKSLEDRITISLPELLKRQKTTTNNSRFLTTAAWLQENYEQSLTTGKVTEALGAARQRKIGNASDCLNQNIRKGFCERRADKTFFVTPAGMEEVGIG